MQNTGYRTKGRKNSKRPIRLDTEMTSLGSGLPLPTTQLSTLGIPRSNPRSHNFSVDGVRLLEFTPGVVGQNTDSQ